MVTDSDARFRLMFERSADAILLLDTTGNKFVEYNQAALDMLRCSKEELSALHPSALSPTHQPDGRDSFSAADAHIARAIAAGSHRFEWVHRSPHRPDFPVEVLLTPIQLGAAPLLLVVWRDITERQQREEALRQAQKLESVGLLAGGIAHDFNNLLTAMIGHLALARRTLGPEHRVDAHLAQVDRAVRQAADLSHQMLAYSGQRALHVEAVELNGAVRELLDLLQVAVGRNIRLTFEPGAAPATIEVNQVELKQVIMNLVTNAAEASQANGEVTVRTRAQQIDAAQAARDFGAQELKAGPHVVLEVEDRGHGMSREVQARIFDPFFSTKGRGRGLGLSALVGIVRSHGGGLRIRSAEGRGTTFEVLFPASTRSTAPVMGRADAASTRGAGRMLLVDDHVGVRAATRALLESMGFEVLEAADGEAAVRAYSRDPGSIRWVLMDLTMPGMSGHDAFRAIRQLDPHARVILSSGWAEQDLAERFRADPPEGFLSKPYRFEDLQAVLERLDLMVGDPGP
jgi:PAS domain S-box-containing protein